jgi:DNA-binding transcriptional ArsR family regulator
MEQPLRVTEVAVVSAVAHPLRRRLLDVLRVHGAQTVGGLSQLTGSAVGNVSHHVRERWWRLVQAGIAWAEDDFGDDPATTAVVSAATQLGLQRQLELTRAWLAAAPEAPQWRRAAMSSDSWMVLSSDELAELAEEVGELLGRWRERGRADDGVERRPVFVFARGFPATP